MLQCSHEKTAVQILWDYDAAENVTYDNLVERLQQRYGNQGQVEIYRIKLRFRKQKVSESLIDLMQGICRLMCLAYPGPTNSTTEAIAKDSFLGALGDRWLARKVYERETRTLDETVAVAMKLESYQLLEPEETRWKQGGRNTPSVQDGHTDTAALNKLTEMLEAQAKEQVQWRKTIEDRLTCLTLETGRGRQATRAESAAEDGQRNGSTKSQCQLEGKEGKTDIQKHRPR